MRPLTLFLILVALYTIYNYRATYIPESPPFAAVKEHYGCGCGG
jgi:hypothetical protein